MTDRLRVLITNDDGIDAPGIRVLAAAVADHGFDPVVAAPVQEASGTSAALTAVQSRGRIVSERRTLPGLPAVPAYAVAASPAFITVLAMRAAFGAVPQAVLAGINRGANAGRAVVHSGTVGAALTAAGDGVPAIAVSLDVLTAISATLTGQEAVDEQGRDWSTAAALTLDLLPVAMRTPAGTVLNLNVPDAPPERQRGLRRAGLARFGQVQLTVAEAGEGFLRMAVEQSTEEPEPGTDLALLAQGYATVTPLRVLGEAVDVDLELPIRRSA